MFSVFFVVVDVIAWVEEKQTSLPRIGREILLKDSGNDDEHFVGMVIKVILSRLKTMSCCFKASRQKPFFLPLKSQ